MNKYCRLCFAEDHVESECVTCARDPHHRGFSIWRWDGQDLFIRTEVSSKWVRVKKTHPTPARVAVLHKLMSRVTAVKDDIDDLI